MIEIQFQVFAVKCVISATFIFLQKADICNEIICQEDRPDGVDVYASEDVKTAVNPCSGRHLVQFDGRDVPDERIDGDAGAVDVFQRLASAIQIPVCFLCFGLLFQQCPLVFVQIMCHLRNTENGFLGIWFPVLVVGEEGLLPFSR